MKSWAAENSSDEDSDDDLQQRANLDIPVFTSRSIDTDLSYDNSTINGAASPDDDVECPPEPPQIDFGHVPPNAPSRAPFTAHIGNLSFGVKEGPELGNEIERLVSDRYNGDESVAVTEARIGVDRDTGKRRGYGYVEFDTLEELLILLNLNDGHSVIFGRMIRIDIAQPRREGPPSRQPARNHRQSSFDNDGYNHGRSQNREQSDPPSNINLPSNIDGNQFRGGIRRMGSMNSAGNGSAAGSMATRPTLKLAPRSKPRTSVLGGSSNIFGGARPREEVVKARQEQAKAEPATGFGNIKRGEEKSAVRGTIDPRHSGGRSGRGAGGGRAGRRPGRGRGDRVRVDASNHAPADVSSRASSRGRQVGGVRTNNRANLRAPADASGRGRQGGGVRTNNRANSRTRTTYVEGETVWNKNTISSNKPVPPSQPVEVFVPIEKNLTKVTNPYSALLGDDSDSE